MGIFGEIEKKKKLRIEAEKTKIDKEYSEILAKENDAKLKEETRLKKIQNIKATMRFENESRFSGYSSGQRLILGLLQACKSPMPYNEFVRQFRLSKLISELDKLDTTDYFEGYRAKIKELEASEI